MKVLSLVLSILALIFCFYLYNDLRLYKATQELIPKEVIIYQIEPKHKKPAFGRTN